MSDTFKKSHSNKKALNTHISKIKKRGGKVSKIDFVKGETEITYSFKK